MPPNDTTVDVDVEPNPIVIVEGADALETSRRPAAVGIDGGSNAVVMKKDSASSSSSLPSISPSASSVSSASSSSSSSSSDDDADIAVVAAGVDELQKTSSAVALYVDNQTVYKDGSPAHVPAGQTVSDIPAAYLTLYEDDAEKARSAWLQTQDWRHQHDVWDIHTRPNPWFYRIKDAYPRHIHGVSKDGYVVVYEQPGQMNARKLFRQDKCTVPDLVHSATFTAEYLANKVGSEQQQKQHDVDDCWGMITVMDLKGAGLGIMKGENFKFLQEDGSIYFDKYYQVHMKRLIIINAPLWLAGVWKGLKSITPDSVVINVCTAKSYPSFLRTHIDEQQIPPEYTGTSPYNLREHPYQTGLEALVDQASAVGAAGASS